MIIAKCNRINNRNSGLVIGETYDVESIHINDSITYIDLVGHRGDYNSVQFDLFTPNGEEFYPTETGEAGDIVHRYGTEIIHDYY